MQINTAKFDGKPVAVVPMESTKKPHFTSRIFSAYAILAFAVVALGYLVAPAHADLTLILPNLTPIGTMLGGLFSAGAVVATPFQAFIEAWFGPIIEAVILFALVGLLIMIFVVAPAKVMGALEHLVSGFKK